MKVKELIKLLQRMPQDAVIESCESDTPTGDGFYHEADFKFFFNREKKRALMLMTLTFREADNEVQ